MVRSAPTGVHQTPIATGAAVALKAAYGTPDRGDEWRPAPAESTVMIMDGDQGDSWQKRYEAGAARNDAANAAWTQKKFGVPLGRTLLQTFPGMVAIFLVSLLMQGWLWGLVSAAVLLAVVLSFRVWARRRYGITTERPSQSS